MVINVVFTSFKTFGIIRAVTQGRPAGATNPLACEAFSGGFIDLNLGGSAAQSVVLMGIVMALMAVQLCHVEHKVHHGSCFCGNFCQTRCEMGSLLCIKSR